MRSAVNALRDLGLATYEAQAYLALIHNQDSSASQVCNETGIPDSKVYFALEELHRKGLIVVREGVPRVYRALHPKEALSKLKSQIAQEYEQRVEKLNQLAIGLEPLYSRAGREDIELAYVLKGFDNVLGRMIELLKSAKREVILFIPNKNIYERLSPQLDTLHRRGVKVKLAVDPRIRKQIDPRHYAEVREIAPSCEDCWLMVVDSKTVISSSKWDSDRCHAILTQDPVLVAMSREYFESPRCCVTT